MAFLFIGLGFAGDGVGLWPVGGGEAAALALFAVACLAMLPRIERPRLSSGDLAGIAAVGFLGAGSSVAYFLATNAGLLSVVVVLASLYPAVRVALAAGLAGNASGGAKPWGWPWPRWPSP